MLIIFRVISFAIYITNAFTLAQNTGATHEALASPIAIPLQHVGALLGSRNVPGVGPPAIDWHDKPAPQVFCTPSGAEGIRVVGVAVLKERVDKSWQVGDSASVQLVLYDHTCRLLNQTVIQAAGHQKSKNFVRWDMDRDSAVSLSMDTMPTYQPAGYCPGGYDCTETPSYWPCGPPASTKPTTTCSVTQGQLNIKTYAWGAGGNTRDQYSNIWVSSATPKDACSCHASSTANGLPDEYIYGCRCNINADMSILMDGESSTGCREESQLGYCPADPGPYAFEPNIPPPWVNSPGRFPNTIGAGIATPLVHSHTKSAVFTKLTQSRLSLPPDFSFSHTLSLHLPHIPVSVSKSPSLKSSVKSKHSSTISTTARRSSSTSSIRSSTKSSTMFQQSLTRSHFQPQF